MGYYHTDVIHGDPKGGKVCDVPQAFRDGLTFLFCSFRRSCAKDEEKSVSEDQTYSSVTTSNLIKLLNALMKTGGSIQAISACGRRKGR